MYIYISKQTKNPETMTTTQLDNGLSGAAVNETLNAEITKRTSELDTMNETGNWTEEMEARGVVLDNELSDLLAARTSYELTF